MFEIDRARVGTHKGAAIGCQCYPLLRQGAAHDRSILAE